MKTYQNEEIQQKLTSLNGWKHKDNSIQKEFVFKDFKQAISFMVKVGEKAEELNHHPNWSNVYNKVDIALSTHDAGGITDKDFELASEIENIKKDYTHTR
jgi:4a-hydroxytetrahydrobiopterin dehydratase